MTKITIKKKLDPIRKVILDDFETEIQTEIENGEWSPIQKNESVELKRIFQEAASAHIELGKSKKITLRINQIDLIKLKAKAKKSNIPYQTLLGALVRDFVDGEYTVKL